MVLTVAQARQQFLEFINLSQIPVVTSLLGLDLIPYHHPLRIGMIGSYGNRWANLAIGEADLLLVIGSRLDIRQTGADIAGFRDNKLIFHIDIDESETNNRVKECTPIISDAHYFLNQVISEYPIHTCVKYALWLEEIKQLKQKWPDYKELAQFPGINPNQLMHQLSKYSQETSAYLADVGNHQMWAAQSLELTSEQFFITSGGMGAMGFALPAGIGCSFALGKKPVIVIVGDGAFQMNIQELQTIVRNQLPIKILVLNNQSLGMIRQFQDSYFASRYQSTCWGYSAPDFAAVATAYNIEAKTICNTGEIESALKWFMQSDTPALLQVMINPKMKAYPKIAFGRPITEMEPFVQPKGIEST